MLDDKKKNETEAAERFNVKRTVSATMTDEDSGSYSKTCYKLKGYPESEFQRWVVVCLVGFFSIWHLVA